MTFNVAKNDVIRLILQGALDTTTTPAKKLYNLFKDDGSGTRYVMTTVGDGYIDMSNLIGITNWNKKDRGYF
mgnify:CR=1 FL=1